MTFDLTPDQRAMTEHLAWLINNPSAWGGALSLCIYPSGAEASYIDLAEWTKHDHRPSGFCHKEIRPNSRLRLFSCIYESDCPDVCPCGEPIPHTGDPTCSAEHNNSSEYDEAIEVN